MKINIRGSVWETNSSMTHSIIILPEYKYNEWKEGLYLYPGDERWRFNKFPEKDKPVPDHLYTLEEVQNFVSKLNLIYDIEEDLSEYTDDEYAEAGFYSFERWPGYFENSATHYTTEGGEKLVIRSYYGYDG